MSASTQSTRTNSRTEVIDRKRAKAAKLHYRLDSSSGIRRKRSGKSFVYISVHGRKLTNQSTIDRLRKLAIPPAWKNVWISPDPIGHLQATGIDAAGRKQYRYHERWSETQDRDKYLNMLKFARALPRIRRRVTADLRRDGLPRQKVLACVIRLLEKTLIRVGNEESAQNNQTYGLTTLKDQHVEVRGTKISFDFKGKSNVVHEIMFRDARLAHLIRQCRDLPGKKLFEYKDDDNTVHKLRAGNVNDYIRECSGGDFSAKDFRTWEATAMTIELLWEFDEFDSQAVAKRNVLQTIKTVAGKLGNTMSVCRKSYIHPAVIQAYLNGSLSPILRKYSKRTTSTSAVRPLKNRTVILSVLKSLCSARS